MKKKVSNTSVSVTCSSGAVEVTDIKEIARLNESFFNLDISIRRVENFSCSFLRSNDFCTKYVTRKCWAHQQWSFVRSLDSMLFWLRNFVYKLSDVINFPVSVHQSICFFLTISNVHSILTISTFTRNLKTINSNIKTVLLLKMIITFDYSFKDIIVWSDKYL